MPAAALSVRISAQIAEFQKSFADASKTLDRFAGDFEGIATRASAVGSFFGNIASDIARSLASGLKQAIGDAVRFSSEFANAFTGLSSVARAFGTDAGLATAAAQQLSSDGLLPVKDAATGLKNLLATGFSLPEATRLMNAFKDSAAFGRSGALSFGDAIRTATEGVKNGNSILVDNAGITKNLSQILKEAGFAATDLSRASSDAAVRHALFNGILKESAAFAGDAARLTETYTGQVSRLEATYNTLLATIGNTITQNATVATAIRSVGDAFNGLNGRLTENQRGFVLVSDAVILMARGFASALNILDLVQTGFAGLQQVSNRVFMGIASSASFAFKALERVNEAMKFLDPAHFQQHTQAVENARQAYTFLDGAVQGFKDATADAETRSITFGNALQGARAEVVTMVADLEATRGKTIELGNAGQVGGARFGDGLEAGSEKAKKALQKVRDMIDGVAAKVNLGLSSLPGFDIDPKTLALPTLPGIEQSIGLSSLPGWEQDLDVLLGKFRTKIGEGFFGPELGQQLAAGLLSAIQGGGNVIGSVAGTLGTKFTSGLAEKLTSGAGVALTGALGTAVNTVLPLIGGLVGPLADKLFGALFKTESRHVNDLRDEFLTAFGGAGTGAGSGFGELARQLNELGAAGDAAFQKLIQASKENDFANAVQRVNDLLEQQKQKQQEVAAVSVKAAEDMQAAQESAIAPIKAHIAELAQEFDNLNRAVASEAPEEEMGIIERNMRARMEAIASERSAQEMEMAKLLDSFISQTDDAAAYLESRFSNIELPPIKVNFDFGNGNTGFAGGSDRLNLDSPALPSVPSSSFAEPEGTTIYFTQEMDNRVITDMVLRNVGDRVRLVT